MVKAIALARKIAPALPLSEVLRMALVTTCGLALILAGPALPY